MINIIGGAGFLGTRLGEVLSDRGINFRSFDKTLENDAYVDVTNPKTLLSLPTADMLINLAAAHSDDITDKREYNIVNVQGARNVCDYCRKAGIHTIVFTSSVAVYGFAPEGTDENGALNPFNDYGQSKVDAEAVYKDWCEEDPEQRSLAIIRPTVIFGENNRGNVYNLFKQIAQRRFVMFGSGKNKKSMAYVQNVAEFLVFCAHLGPGVHIYNYVDQPDWDMNTLVLTCRTALLGKRNVGIKMPAWTGLAAGYFCDVLSGITGKSLPVSYIRVKKFMETTAFKSSAHKTGFTAPVPIDLAIARTLDHEFSRSNF